MPHAIQLFYSGNSDTATIMNLTLLSNYGCPYGVLFPDLFEKGQQALLKREKTKGGSNNGTESSCPGVLKFASPNYHLPRNTESIDELLSIEL